MKHIWLIFYLKLCAAFPNVVILLADDLGIGDVGCFGNDSIKTPNIDVLANRGIKLNHHLAAAAVCTPSRAALLTGRYPVRSGMESSGRNKVFFFVAASGGLPENETTIAKLLKEKGYETAIIGKWHLGNNGQHLGDLMHHPLNHGFDRFYGLPLSNFKDFGNDGQSVITAYVQHFYKYLCAISVCGFSIFFNIRHQYKKTSWFILLLTVVCPSIVVFFLVNLKTINGVLMRNDEVVEQPLNLVGLTQRFVHEASSFIEDSVSKKKPFFLFLPFVHVHSALFTVSEFRGRSAHGRYGDNVEELDWGIGQIMASLQKHGVANNTIVYFSSDNGGHVEEVALDGEREGGHNGIFKGGKTIAGFEGGIRVPSIILWPNQIKVNGEINVTTSQMDILPTLMDAVEIPLPTDRILDGKSLLPLLKNHKQRHHDILFHYCGIYIHAATYIQPYENRIWKIHWTTPRFKANSSQCEFVCHCFGKFVTHHDPPLLYNLSDDPSEENPLDANNYSEIIVEAHKLRLQHEKTIHQVPDQFSFFNTLWKPWLQPCCNFPRCFCYESKYQKYYSK